MADPTLTDIDGIGPATATKLETAGIKTVADLAAAEADKLEQLDGMPPGAKFADWIAAAKQLQGDTEEIPEIHEANGADAEAEGAAASEDNAEAKVSEAKGADAADPAGTAGASAAQAEESREQAPTASPDRKDAQGEENQPGETAQPPVAEHDVPVLVVTGPKKGFRRGGYRFDAQPRPLRLQDFENNAAGMRHFLAILNEARLRVVILHPDGIEEPVPPEVIETLEGVLHLAEGDEFPPDIAERIEAELR